MLIRRIAATGLLALWFALAPVSAQQSQVLPVPGNRADSSPPSAAPLGSNTRSSGVSSLLVTDIQWRGVELQPAAAQHLRELITQPLNAPLDRAQVRRSLQALYATGRFADLQVEAERTQQNQLTLVFIARENFFVGAVTVEGVPRRPTANQLVNASKLQLGELFTREKVEAALRSMKAVLMDNGFYKAVITDTEDFHDDTQQVDVHFQVAPDGRARIGEVAIKGDPGLPPERIEHIADFSTGHTVTAQRVTKALQKLRKKYQKQGRLEAQVAITGRSYRPQDNTLDYVLEVNQGPLVDVRLQGARISASKLKKYVPIYQEGAVDDDLLNEGIRNLRDYFETKGYFDVRVSWDREYVPEEHRLHVIYRIQLGIRHKLDALRISGNNYFDTPLIQERMRIRASTPLMPHGLFSESMLARDIQAIEAMYRANGFQHVSIERETQDDYRGVKGHMMVTLRINEGPQVRVANVKLAGNRAFPDSVLVERMSTIPGQPFSEVNVAQDRESILNFYFNRGFPNVEFESTATPVKGNPNLMDVAYTVSEGDQIFVDRVLVSGLHYTRPYVVHRELRVSEGDPLSQFSMVESQRHLYDLGIFNEVDVAVQNPEGQGRYKNVLFQMREARRWTFNYGFGFQVQTGGQPADVSQINTAPAPGVDVPPHTTPPTGSIPVNTNPQGGTSFSPDFLFEVTRVNFRGRDHTLSFKSRYGNVQKRALFSYEAPRFWDRENMRLTFTGFYDNSRDVRTFTSERLEGSVQIEDVLTRTATGQAISTLLWRYNYRRVKVDPASLAISPVLVPLLSKPALLGIPSATYVRDKRDDPLDPHKGNYTTVDFGVSAKIFGSASVKGTAEEIAAGGTQAVSATAANFTRLNAQNSNYVPLRNGIVLARSTRIGMETTFGGNAGRLAIPLPERFFSGGVITHRGFALNQAGPRDLTTGFPIGGQGMFVNNLEVRFPPPLLPLVGNNLSFVLFHDSGNVFKGVSEMGRSLFRWYQPNRSDCHDPKSFQRCRFDYMSQAAGAGIRYRTPIGPVRVDVSYNLNPPSFPFFVQCPSFTWTGEPEPCVSAGANALVFQHATLRHFNFFFSIGQTF